MGQLHENLTWISHATVYSWTRLACTLYRMALSRLTSLSLAAVGSVLIAAIFTATPELGRAGKGGKGEGGGSTSGVVPVSAHFEAMAAQIQADGPLIDASLDPDGGWSNLTEIGNYTFQIGTRGKRAKEGDCTLTLYLDQPVGGGPIGPNLDFKIVWMAFNREQCIAPDASNAFGDCPADQWFNRLNDPAEYNSDARPGLRDMVCGEEINVSLTLRGEDVTGTAQFLSCNESTSHNDEDVYPDIEFGTAACVHAADGACDRGCPRNS